MISRELFFQNLERWHPNNPKRGIDPSCGYCEDCGYNCPNCQIPKEVCEKEPNPNGYDNGMVNPYFTSAMIIKPTTLVGKYIESKSKEDGEIVYLSLIIEGIRLGYCDKEGKPANA
jgi:hypothetical protein